MVYRNKGNGPLKKKGNKGNGRLAELRILEKKKVVTLCINSNRKPYSLFFCNLYTIQRDMNVLPARNTKVGF